MRGYNMQIMITIAIQTENELIGEGDNVKIKDNWDFEFIGTITYIDEDVIELKNRDNLTRAIDIESITEISKIQ